MASSVSGIGKLVTEYSVVKSVVRWMGGTGAIGLLGVIVLLWVGVDPAAVAIVGTLAGTSIGGLNSLLARTSSAPEGGSVPVTIQNEGPEEAVPTESV